MAKNYRGDTGRMHFTAGSALSSGDPHVLNTDTFGVVEDDVASGDVGVLNTLGQYELTCLGTDVIDPGADLYWDAGNSRLTLTASTHKWVGKAANSSPNGTTLVVVELHQTEHA